MAIRKGLLRLGDPHRDPGPVGAAHCRDRAVQILVGVLLVLLLLAGPGPTRAADVPVPELRARVTDVIGLLPADLRAALEARLQTFEREKGSQVAVLIVATTQPETIEQYSIRVVDAWKLGREKPDDGVLLLVAQSDRALRIEVGRGLEGAIPDAIAKRVIEETIVPRFREGDVAGGIEAGVEALLGLIQGEPLPQPRAPSQEFPGGDSPLIPLLLGVLVAGQFLRRLLGPLFAGLLVGTAGFAAGLMFTGQVLVAVLAAAVLFVLCLVGAAGGGLGGGIGRGGGSGGGRFSGGGGSFGGGGASGRW